MTTITETDHRVITEAITTEIIQITRIVVTAITEIIETTIIVIPTVQFQIIVIIKDTIHDHHINIHDHRTSPDHHILEIETLIAITEVDTTATIEIEDQIIKTTDKVVITKTAIIINHTIDKTELESIILKTNHTKMNRIHLELKSAITQQILWMKILEKFYNAQENTCNSINTIESNPTWILPRYQCTSLETDFKNQKPILETDFLLDSGATLNLLNEDTRNELKYNKPHLQLTKSIRTLTAANNTKIETLGTINVNVTPERISNIIFNIFFYLTQCNHNVLGTPFFKEYIETINVNTNKLTINTPTDFDNEIHFFQNTTKEYPYYSRIYPVYNKETHYFEPHEHNCLTFPIPNFKRMEKSNGKILHGSLHYFELKYELTGFIYQNTTFKTFHMEVYQTNSLEIFSALYHLTYENENDIIGILQINNDESINQVATFERKPNFKSKFNITKYNDKDKEFIQMFNFEHSYLTQEQFHKIVDIIMKYRNVYATTKFEDGKTKIKLNLPMKKDAVFKNQTVSKVPIHLRDRIQKLLDVLKKYNIISPVNKEQLSTGNTFTNQVIILQKGESLQIVLDARYLNSMIDQSKCNWPIEPVDVALIRINGTIFTTADLNSAYNPIPLDKESMRYTQFTIGNEQYCFKRLFYGISIGPAAFASILTHYLYPLIRNGTVITYVDDIFIQTTTYV